MARPRNEREEPELEIGTLVVAREPNITPWIGEVVGRKWSAASGWWYEVRDDDHMTRSFCGTGSLDPHLTDVQQGR